MNFALGVKSRYKYIYVYCIRKIEKLENKQTNSSTTVRAYK